MMESEEASTRYGYIFQPASGNFDGNTMVQPTSNVQRVYQEAFLNASKFMPLRNFSSLIKAASYAASDCHRRDGANSNRDWYVQQLRAEGVRVDGLGRCMRSLGPEGITLMASRDAYQRQQFKREAISHYLFHFAFENSIEDGYVTEKPFDALRAGVVPVYLGDAKHFRSLLPHPKAAILVADYNGNLTALAQYLLYLSENETAYEEHRQWRHNFSYEDNIRDKPLLHDSWYCRVCRWAVDTAPLHQNRQWKCDENGELDRMHELEGKAVRAEGKTIYIVQNQTLRSIPDFATMLAMKIEPQHILQLSRHQAKVLKEGPPMPALAAPEDA